MDIYSKLKKAASSYNLKLSNFLNATGLEDYEYASFVKSSQVMKQMNEEQIEQFIERLNDYKTIKDFMLAENVYANITGGEMRTFNRTKEQIEEKRRKESEELRSQLSTASPKEIMEISSKLRSIEIPELGLASSDNGRGIKTRQGVLRAIGAREKKLRNPENDYKSKAYRCGEWLRRIGQITGDLNELNQIGMDFYNLDNDILSAFFKVNPDIEENLAELYQLLKDKNSGFTISMSGASIDAVIKINNVTNSVENIDDLFYNWDI